MPSRLAADHWSVSPETNGTRSTPPATELSQGTVKTHLGRVFTKLGLRDRAQAVAFAYETGLVVAGSEPET